MPAKNAHDDVDVLIVGGGPTGLAAANALGRRGVRCLLIEAEADVATLPRAVSVDDEAMRFLSGLGLGDAVRAIVVPGTGTKYYGADGRLLAYGRGPDHERYGHPVKNPIDHPEFQRLLLSGAQRLAAVAVGWSTQLVDFTQSPDRVTATVEREGQRRTVACRYLLGADGGRSLVRRIIGQEPMPGMAFEERWLVLDTVNDAHDERFAMHHGDPERPRVVIVGREGRCRYEFLLNDDENPQGPEVLELARRLVAPYRPLGAEDVVRCTVYKFYALVARRFRQDRAFIAGDAAHMMPPFAGQGLNSGLRDAANLSWKLSEVLRGAAGSTLLDTYEQERRPHVEATVRLSVRMGAMMMTRSRARAVLRDGVIRAGQRVPGVGQFFRELRFRPPARYERGFVLPTSADAGPVGAMLVRPRVYQGDGRFPDLDDELGPGYALLAVGGEPAGLSGLTHPLWDRLQATRVHLTIGDRLPARGAACAVLCDVDGFLGEQLGSLAGQIVLVRPDRFIAGAFDPAAETAAAAQVGAHLGVPAGVSAGDARRPEEVRV